MERRYIDSAAQMVPVSAYAAVTLDQLFTIFKVSLNIAPIRVSGET
jgi:hypothetical protein